MAAVQTRRTHTAMAITIIDTMLPQLRLMHLISPSLPVGAYSYSQGLEWAVECGWVTDKESLAEWIRDIALTNLAGLEIPVLARLYRACEEKDAESLAYWSDYLVASRETMELRQEEKNRARALMALLPKLEIPVAVDERICFESCQLTGFAHAAQHWNIPMNETAAGYIWGWCENITLAGVKIIPLGQTAGQQILAEITPMIPAIVTRGLECIDDEIGASCMAQAIASSRHETQYTRIYRS
ncbi:urease accessory protein UreF [Solemya velum gill symbiont]|nr:urease accessory protein UreF [Solemya velum gill symbiont]